MLFNDPFRPSRQFPQPIKNGQRPNDRRTTNYDYAYIHFNLSLKHNKLLDSFSIIPEGSYVVNEYELLTSSLLYDINKRQSGKSSAQSIGFGRGNCEDLTMSRCNLRVVFVCGCIVSSVPTNL